MKIIIPILLLLFFGCQVKEHGFPQMYDWHSSCLYDSITATDTITGVNGSVMVNVYGYKIEDKFFEREVGVLFKETLRDTIRTMDYDLLYSKSTWR